MSLTITWLGHACFWLEGSNGTNILIDPMLPGMGYTLPDLSAVDLVLITHRHRDHAYIEDVPAEIPILFGLDDSGHFQAIDRWIEGANVANIAAYHDETQGSVRGEDALWLVIIDGLRLLHMGDFGQVELTVEQLGQTGQVDVLMLPVGGTYTVDGAGARRIVAQLQPALVIPMHYKTAALSPDAPHEPVDVFLGHAAPTDAPHSIRVNRDELTAGTTAIVVMSYE